MKKNKSLFSGVGDGSLVKSTNLRTHTRTRTHTHTHTHARTHTRAQESEPARSRTGPVQDQFKIFICHFLSGSLLITEFYMMITKRRPCKLCNHNDIINIINNK